jgi:hypothetical protein
MKLKPKERIKKGRRLYGGIYRLPSGREIYLAYRKQGEIFRSGKANISEAIREGVACWAIDHDTLLQMRAKGIKIVGVFNEEDGDVWLTTLDAFMDPTAATFKNYEARGGALQRYLPLSYFRRRSGVSIAR